MVAALGSILVVAAVARNSLALLFVGFFRNGARLAANMQALYAAVDLAPPVLRDLGVPTIARSRPHRLWRSWHGRLALHLLNEPAPIEIRIPRDRSAVLYGALISLICARNGK